MNIGLQHLTPDERDLVAGLCSELRLLLDAELIAGNRVIEAWRTWGCVVMLETAFKLKHRIDKTRIRFRTLNDPHYWLAEYHAMESDQTLA